MRVVVLFTGVGVLLIVCTMLGWRGGWIADPTASFFFLAAAVLIGGSAIFAALQIPRIPWVTTAFVTGAALLILSQILNTADNVDSLRFLPLIGRRGAFYFPHIDDILLYIGVGTVCACCYLAVLDAALARIRSAQQGAQRELALREAEQYAAALTESEQIARNQLAELENLYDTAPVGLCVVDQELRFVKANRRMSEMDGVPVKEHLGRLVDIKVGEVGPRLAQMCREVLLTGKARANAEFTLSPDEASTHERVIWLISCFPISELSGQVKGVQVVAQDISDLKEAQANQRQLEYQVQRAQKLESLGVLAGGIAHDFNNLLTGILGNVSLILQGEELPQRTSLLMQRIESAAKRAAELTRQMLAYAGQGALEARLIDMAALIREASPLLHASITKRAEFLVDCPDKLPPVVGDVAQLRQVVMNMVINASESLGEFGGRIEVHAGTRYLGPEDFTSYLFSDEPWPGEYVYVAVTDSGCGIEQEELSRIFDPFYSTKFTGRGLGLAVVVGIVRRHKGALQVESHVGEGSTFSILLPVGAKALNEAAPQATHLDSQGARNLILVIDDEVAVRETASEMLRELGLEVLCAQDGDEGEALFNEHHGRIKAVLLDMTMPGRSASDVYYTLRDVDPVVPVIVSSGFSEEHVRSLFEPGERLWFLPKPYSFDSLARHVRSACPV